jgi:hypothetical protein
MPTACECFGAQLCGWYVLVCWSVFAGSSVVGKCASDYLLAAACLLPVGMLVLVGRCVVVKRAGVYLLAAAWLISVLVLAGDSCVWVGWLFGWHHACLCFCSCMAGMLAGAG